MKMNEQKQRRKRLFANTLHRKIFLLVLVASFLPTTIVTVSLYYLIFGITADQIGIPESIAYNIIPAARRVTTILLIAAPVVIAVILILAHKVAHKMVGPFDRIVRELGECVAGTRQGPITLRKSDEFRPLVDQVNKLLDKAASRGS